MALDDAEVHERPKRLPEEVRGAAGEGRVAVLLELRGAPQYARARCGALPVLRTSGGPIPYGEGLPDHGARRVERLGGDPTGEPVPTTKLGGWSASVAGPTPGPTSPRSEDVAGSISGPFPPSRTVGQDKALALLPRTRSGFPA